MVSGVWTIVIQGTGQYQSQDIITTQYDADRLLGDFASQLKNFGHTIQSSTFLAGQPTITEISPGQDVGGSGPP